MGRTCSACVLNKRPPKKRGRRLFKLPNDEKIARQVLNNLGFAPNFKPNRYSRLCELHFTPESIYKSRLVDFPQTTNVIVGIKPELISKPKLENITESFEETAIMKVEREGPSASTINDNSCRVCLSSEESQLQDLSVVEVGDVESYLSKLTFVSCIQIEDLDSPRNICNMCIDLLKIACDVKRKCIETDELLKELKQKAKVHEELVCEIKEEMLEPEEEHISELQENESCEFEGDEQHAFEDGKVEFEEDETNEFGQIDDDYPTNEDVTINDFNEIFNEDHEASDSKKAENVVQHDCIFCDKILPSVKLKKQHMKTEHADILVCRECGMKKNSVFSVEACIQVHMFGFPHLCQHCGMGFKRKGHCEEHLRMVHAPDSMTLKFFCDICGTKMKYKASMGRHMKTMHSKASKRFVCPHKGCKEKYTARASLNLHMYRNHKVAAPVICQNCGDGFNNQSEVKSHLKSCLGIRSKRRKKFDLTNCYDVIDGQYHCRLCTKVFSSKQYYGFHHVGYHRDNKTCKECNRTYASARGYSKHVKIVHLKIKNFACDFIGCGKTFGTRCILEGHQNTHTGKKSFACSQCDFKSGDQPGMSKHRKNMHS